MRLRLISLRLLALVALVACAANLRAASWSLLFVFGDSYSDSGAGYVYADGPTAVVYLAQGLNIPFTHANDPQRAGKGLNFAVSGAQTGANEGRQVGDALFGRGLWDQVQDFAARVKAGEITFDPERTIFFLAGGLNDGRLANETTVGNLRNEIRALYGAGARHFYVALLPSKIPGFGALGRKLNASLAQIPELLHLDGATIQMSHWGDYFDEVFVNAKTYGITHLTEACAGRTVFGEDPTPKGDPKTYYFYYASHPSTAVHRIVGEKLVAEMKSGAR